LFGADHTPLRYTCAVSGIKSNKRKFHLDISPLLILISQKTRTLLHQHVSCSLRMRFFSGSTDGVLVSQGDTKLYQNCRSYTIT